MDTLRNIGIPTVEYTVLAIKLVQYCILLPFTPILEVITKKILFGYDIQVNGNRPWDIQVLDKRFYARLVTYGNMGIGESFMEKWISCKDVRGFGCRISPVYKMWHSFFWNKFLLYLRFQSFNLQSKERASRSCNTHYNLDPEYFESFLDESSTYSIGYWETNAATLSEAQTAKFELAAQKLNLKPGMRVLDLGCGFGGLSRYFAKNYQVQVVGITNSTSMGKEAARRCQGTSVDIQITDWRDFEGKFDRIVCVEMVLHVGLHNLKELFIKAKKWLNDDGLFLIQDLAMSQDWPASDDFISKYFFPNIYFAPIEEVLEKSRGILSFENYQDMNKDVAKTAKCWIDKFKQNWHKIKHLYSQKLYEATIYFYTMGLVCGDIRVLFAYQMVLKKNSVHVS